MTDMFDEYVNAKIVSFIPYQLYADLTLSYPDIIIRMLARPRLAYHIYAAHKPFMTDEEGISAGKFMSSIVKHMMIIPIGYSYVSTWCLEFIRHMETLDEDDMIDFIYNNPKETCIHRYINNRCSITKDVAFAYWPEKERYRLSYGVEWEYVSHREMYLSALVSLNNCVVTRAVKEAYETCPGFREMTRKFIVEYRVVEFAGILKDQEMLEIIGASHYRV